MYIKQLDVIGVRNLKAMQLPLVKGVNVFYGPNGSGKTSLLEAIYVLAMGRSFRTANLQQLINIEQARYVISSVVVAEDADNFQNQAVNSWRLGMEKSRNHAKALFIKDGEKCTIAAIAKLLPILLLDSSSLELIIGGPGSRRAFIDFGMFHVEHCFFEDSHKFKKSLLQRNALLKSKASVAQKQQQLAAWDDIFLTAAAAITAYRKQFVVEFAEIFKRLISGWKYYGHVSFKYKQGWAAEHTLQQVLADNVILDIMSGVSNFGPHRAELEILIDGISAKQLLSRGQQKVFVCAMNLAKAIFWQERAKIDSIFLVDDLASELDQAAFQLVIDKLTAINGQVFITSIEKEPVLTATKAAMSLQLEL